MSRDDEDMRMLRELCVKADELDAASNDADAAIADFKFPDKARTAFRQMLSRARPLSERQRAWVRGVYETVFDAPVYENLASSGNLCRGREVELLVERMPKPKKPPARRHE